MPSFFAASRVWVSIFLFSFAWLLVVQFLSTRLVISLRFEAREKTVLVCASDLRLRYSLVLCISVVDCAAIHKDVGCGKREIASPVSVIPKPRRSDLHTFAWSALHCGKDTGITWASDLHSANNANALYAGTANFAWSSILRESNCLSFTPTGTGCPMKLSSDQPVPSLNGSCKQRRCERAWMSQMCAVRPKQPICGFIVGGRELTGSTLPSKSMRAYYHAPGRPLCCSARHAVA